MKTVPLNEALDLLGKEGYDDNQKDRVRSWHDADRYVLVFENHDLGHRACGHKFAMPWDDGETIPPHGPDHPSIGMGWRYVTAYVVEPEPSSIVEL